MIGWALEAYKQYQNRNLKPTIIPASLFYQSEGVGFISKNENQDFQSLPFDLLINERHSLDFDISDHAVENGATISDHVTERLRSVQVTGFFTNHSINKNAYVSNGEIKDADSVELVDVESANYAIGNTARDVMLKRLIDLARSHAKVRVVTQLEIYDEMVIEHVDYDRGPDDGECITFRVQLREIKTARIESRSISGVWNPPEPIVQEKPEQKAMSKKNSKGKVSGKETDPDEIAKKLEAAKGGRVI